MFGSRQLFQLIVPLQANNEIEKKKCLKKADTDMKDIVEKEQMFLFKNTVDSLVLFDKLLKIRIKQKRYCVKNLEWRSSDSSRYHRSKATAKTNGE
ncbi:hypothetical protein RFI_39077 [Reticulomyxa filosa]|uniref:Uncharacterized protein n=1 Tax=Reticulomyxa filosa TaxID=46433 RepID=X6LCI1_RETFI|nr:hypothetical protein RFI_39077 [Reticulomyxa filosa]|eukprot:ETN98419.1 hypothetical protein RFI_39077 [Reticulomyxa filosa]